MKTIKDMIHNLPYIEKFRKNKILFPPGHYHSPVPSKEEILSRKKQIFGFSKKEIEAIDLNEPEQVALLEKIRTYYSEIPFKSDKSANLRYYFENDSYSYSDAIFLYSVIRHFRPGKIIEAGSGFSSAVMLDTNERFFENRIQCTFIEPYPKRLFSILKEDDRKNHRVIERCIQDVDAAFFAELKENDILFIDTSHVSKTGSDVNYILFEILPKLKKGVLIHFHDIFYPFEYPEEWVLNGRAWNENYILRAFLQYNSRFKIVLFNTFLEYYYRDWFDKNMPLCLKNKGGSIWLVKL